MVSKQTFYYSVCFILNIKVHERKCGQPPVSILHKSIKDSYRPDRYPVGPITIRYRFKQNDSMDIYTIKFIISKSNWQRQKLKLSYFSYFFLISAQKYKLWVLVRTASPRRF